MMIFGVCFILYLKVSIRLQSIFTSEDIDNNTWMRLNTISRVKRDISPPIRFNIGWNYPVNNNSGDLPVPYNLRYLFYREISRDPLGRTT